MRSLSGSTYLSALNWKPWETNFKGQIEKTLQMRLNSISSKRQCRPKAHAVYIQQETIDCIPARIHPAHPAAHALTAAKCNIHKSKSYSAINAFCVAFVSQLFGCVCFMQQSTILTPFHAVGSTQPTLAASIKNFDCHCFCLYPVTRVPAIVAAAAATDTACAAVIDTLRYAYLRTASAAFHFRACALPLPHAACLLLPFVRVVAQFYYLCAAIKYLSLRARQVYRQAVAAVRIQRCIKRVAFLQFAPLLQLTRL